MAFYIMWAFVSTSFTWYIAFEIYMYCKMCEYFIPFSHKKMSYMNFVAICVGSKESLDDKGSGIIPPWVQILALPLHRPVFCF